MDRQMLSAAPLRLFDVETAHLIVLVRPIPRRTTELALIPCSVRIISCQWTSSPSPAFRCINPLSAITASSHFARPRKRRKFRPQSLAKYKDRDAPMPNTLLMKGPMELVEVGEKNADEFLRWMNRKVLEDFKTRILTFPICPGTSSAALDVTVGVTSEYFLNVGRPIRFMYDKYAKSMMPEVRLAFSLSYRDHLFESGIARIQDLERYIKDDVVRHGSRLVDLEKKLVGAYREATQVEVVDDDALFAGEDDEEDESAFVMGGFSDSLGDDFLGLRELGIAAELGLSSLTIPKKLLKGKSRGTAGAAVEYVSFIQSLDLSSDFISFSEQNPKNRHLHIHHRLRYSLSQARMWAIKLGLPYFPPGPQFGLLPHPGVLPLPYAPSPSGEFTRVIAVPDDAPAPAQAKLGPLGQVLKTGAAAGTIKKKNKAKEPVSMSVPDMSDAVPIELTRAFNGLGAEGRDVGGAGAGGGGINGLGGDQWSRRWGDVKYTGWRQEETESVRTRAGKGDGISTCLLLLPARET
ncbi:hypothetical protein BDR04DRAFT_1152331 [Suillus decipiens]|nr:hypothetical protein BDR04DRAFT_1152331 [Suillus decipiens]